MVRTKIIFSFLLIGLIPFTAMGQARLARSSIDELCNPALLKVLGVPAEAIGTLTNFASGTVAQADKLVKDALKTPEKAKDALEKEFTNCALRQPGLNAILSTAKLAQALSGLIGQGVGVVGIATQAVQQCADQASDKLKDQLSDKYKDQKAKFIQCMANIPGLPSIISDALALVNILKQLQSLLSAAQTVVQNGTGGAAMNCLGGIPGAQAIAGIIGQCTGIASGVDSVWKVYSSVAGAGSPQQLAGDFLGCAKNGAGTFAGSALGPLADSVTGITGGIGNMIGGLGNVAGDLMKLPSKNQLNEIIKACKVLRTAGAFRR